MIIKVPLSFILIFAGKPKAMKCIPFYVLFFLCFQASFAQNFPDPGPVYPDHEVSRIDILIPPDSLDAIYDNLENEYEYHATFIFHNSQVVGDTLTNIGFRLRGETSLYSEKKSFKVSFNTYVPGRKYKGLEKMNLNGEHNDPSIIRSELCWNLCRNSLIPAPRSAYAELYINGSYYGLYMNVEHIDENFVKSRFGNNNGNLYKCTWPADLIYLGDDPDLYKYGDDDSRAYELKTNQSQDDYSDLASFIDVLNNTPADSLHLRLDQVFNIQSFLKYLAFECATGNWDGYSYNKNNYYLYHNISTGKFEFIPYDLDNTFGIDWMNIDWANRNIYSWMSDESRPLTKRLLQNQYYRRQFSFYIRQFLEDFFYPQALFPVIDSTYLMIYPYAAADPYRPLDYGWTSMQFTASYTQALGAHVKYGLKPYITTRLNSALQQLEDWVAPSLVINEFMADNESVIMDPFGEYDDWIEIFNPGGESVNLGDIYLTDDLNDPVKWQLPPVTMDSGDYVLIWADGQTEQGDYHASFKLEKKGEQLGLFTSPSTGSLPVDILTFGNQNTDVSSGLYLNGNGVMQFLLTPTPGSSNSQPIGIKEVHEDVSFNVFPNPFINEINIYVEGVTENKPILITLNDIFGRCVFEDVLTEKAKHGNSFRIYPDIAETGIYFITFRYAESYVQSMKIIHFP